METRQNSKSRATGAHAAEGGSTSSEKRDDAFAKTKKSEQRRRQATITLRVTAEEKARAQELAAERGLSVGAYFRLRALGEIGERAQRRPRPGRQAIGELGAELQRLSAAHNKIGSNFNQLARKANTDGFEQVAAEQLERALAEYEAAVAEISAMRDAVLKALGYGKSRGSRAQVAEGDSAKSKRPDDAFAGDISDY